MRDQLSEADADVRVISESRDLILAVFLIVLRSPLVGRHDFDFATNLICVF